MRQTFITDRLRAFACGPFTAISGAPALVVAVQHFHASVTLKMLIATAGGLGVLVSPLAAMASHTTGVAASRLQAVLLLVAAGALMLVACVPGPEVFAGGMAVALVTTGACSSLVSAYWSQNLPPARRGVWFGHATRAEVIGCFITVLLLALWLGPDAGGYQGFFMAIAACLGLAAWSSYRIPSQVVVQERWNPLGCLPLLRHDPQFGRMNLAYTLTGIGSLMAGPMRAEYLASPTVGLGYRADMCQLLLMVIPTIVRMVTLPWWGRIQDRQAVERSRSMINACWALALVCLFTPWWPVQVLGSMALGSALAANDVMWSLWVYRYAPAGKGHDYMSVHLILSGLRMVLGPILGYALAAWMLPQHVAWVCIIIIVASSMIVTGSPRNLPKSST